MENNPSIRIERVKEEIISLQNKLSEIDESHPSYNTYKNLLDTQKSMLSNLRQANELITASVKRREFIDRLDKKTKRAKRLFLWFALILFVLFPLMVHLVEYFT